MPKLARLAQGRYYFTEKIREIAAHHHPGSGARQARSTRRRTHPAAIRHIQSDSAWHRAESDSIANGHIATTPKDTAEVVLATDENAPLLAQWHYGLGRAVAWTSDLGTRWTSGWLNWDENTRFWDQMLRWAMGPPINRDFRVDVSRVCNVARVSVEDITDGPLRRYAAVDAYAYRSGRLHVSGGATPGCRRPI